MPRCARRPLDPSEVSWILADKILGKIPIRMFSPPERIPLQAIAFPEPDAPRGEDYEIGKQNVNEQ